MAAKTYKVPEGATITIKNNAETAYAGQAYTGPKTEMTLEDARKANITGYEYALKDNGDFVTVGASKPAADGSNVVVIVRQAIKNTDRFVQFYRTQQKIKLAKGDSVEIPVASAAEVAYYLQFDGVDGLTAKASSGVIA